MPILQIKKLKTKTENNLPKDLSRCMGHGRFVTTITGGERGVEPCPPILASSPHSHVPDTSNSSRPLLSAGSGWGNRGSSGGGVGIRGGGRMCRSLDTSEGLVTSPPCRKERPLRGVWLGGQGSFPGAGVAGRAGAHTRKNSLSWGLLLSAGMCTVKRSRSSAPFLRSSITEASNRPEVPGQGSGQSGDHRGF